MDGADLMAVLEERIDFVSLLLRKKDTHLKQVIFFIPIIRCLIVEVVNLECRRMIVEDVIANGLMAIGAYCHIRGLTRYGSERLKVTCAEFKLICRRCV
jgi:hypothetical protein